MLMISGICCIVMAEKKKKTVPIYAVVAFLCFAIGIIFLGYEIISNMDKTKGVATFIGYEEVRNAGGEQWPVLEFYVGQERYQSLWPELKNASVGDEIEIYYYQTGDSYECTLFVEDYRMIYIPLFVLGILLLFFRRKNQGR